MYTTHYIEALILLFLLAVSFFYIKIRVIIQFRFDKSTPILEIEIRIFLKKLYKTMGTVTEVVSPVIPLDYNRIANLSLKYLIIEEINWETIIGFNNAMHTAILSGSLWAIKGSFVSIVSRICRLKKVNIDIKPDFTGNTQRSSLNCILKMRMVHIILIVAYYFVLKVRGYLSGYTGKAEPSH